MLHDDTCRGRRAEVLPLIVAFDPATVPGSQEREARIRTHAARVASECPDAIGVCHSNSRSGVGRCLLLGGVCVQVYRRWRGWYWRLPVLKPTRADRGKGPFPSREETLADAERSLADQGNGCEEDA